MIRGALICVVVFGCGPKAAQAPATPPNASERGSCAVANECTLVQACCGCNAGGRQVAIRKDAVAEYDRTRPQRCGDQMCAQMISSDPSCDAEATCEADHCKVVAHIPLGAPLN